MAGRRDFFVEFGSNADTFAQKLYNDLEAARAAIATLQGAGGAYDATPPLRPGGQGASPPRKTDERFGMQDAGQAWEDGRRADVQKVGITGSTSGDMHTIAGGLQDIAEVIPAAVTGLKAIDSGVESFQTGVDNFVRALNRAVQRLKPPGQDVVTKPFHKGKHVSPEQAVELEKSGEKIDYRLVERSTNKTITPEQAAAKGYTSGGGLDALSASRLVSAIDMGTDATKQVRKEVHKLGSILKKGMPVTLAAGATGAPAADAAAAAAKSTKSKAEREQEKALSKPMEPEGMSMAQALAMSKSDDALKAATVPEMQRALRVFEAGGFKPIYKWNTKTRKSDLAERLKEARQDFSDSGGFRMGDPDAPTKVSKLVTDMTADVRKFYNDYDDAINKATQVLEQNRMGGGKIPKNERIPHPKDGADDSTTVLPQNVRADTIQFGSQAINPSDRHAVRAAAIFQKRFYGGEVPRMHTRAALGAMEKMGMGYNPFSGSVDEQISGTGREAREARSHLKVLRKAQARFDKGVADYYEEITSELNAVMDQVADASLDPTKKVPQHLLDRAKELKSMKAHVDQYMPGVRTRTEDRERYLKQQEEIAARQEAKRLRQSTIRRSALEELFGGRQINAKREESDLLKLLPGLGIGKKGNLTVDPGGILDGKGRPLKGDRLKQLENKVKSYVTSVQKLLDYQEEHPEDAQGIKDRQDRMAIKRSNLIKKYRSVTGQGIGVEDFLTDVLQNDGTRKPIQSILRWDASEQRKLAGERISSWTPRDTAAEKEQEAKWGPEREAAAELRAQQDAEKKAKDADERKQLRQKTYLKLLEQERALRLKLAQAQGNAQGTARFIEDVARPRLEEMQGTHEQYPQVRYKYGPAGPRYAPYPERIEQPLQPLVGELNTARRAQTKYEQEAARLESELGGVREEIAKYERLLAGRENTSLVPHPSARFGHGSQAKEQEAKSSEETAKAAEASAKKVTELNKKNRKEFVKVAQWAQGLSVKQISEAIESGKQSLPEGWGLKAKKSGKDKVAAEAAAAEAEAAAETERILTRKNRKKFTKAAPWARGMSVNDIEAEIAAGNQQVPPGWAVSEAKKSKSTAGDSSPSGILNKILTELRGVHSILKKQFGVTTASSGGGRRRRKASGEVVEEPGTDLVPSALRMGARDLYNVRMRYRPAGAIGPAPERDPRSHGSRSYSAGAIASEPYNPQARAHGWTPWAAAALARAPLALTAARQPLAIEAGPTRRRSAPKPDTVESLLKKILRELEGIHKKVKSGISLRGKAPLTDEEKKVAAKEAARKQAAADAAPPRKAELDRAKAIAGSDAALSRANRSELLNALKTFQKAGYYADQGWNSRTKRDDLVARLKEAQAAYLSGQPAKRTAGAAAGAAPATGGKKPWKDEPQVSAAARQKILQDQPAAAATMWNDPIKAAAMLRQAGVSMRQAYGVVQPHLSGGMQERGEFEKAVREQSDLINYETRQKKKQARDAEAAQRKAEADAKAAQRKKTWKDEPQVTAETRRSILRSLSPKDFAHVRATVASDPVQAAAVLRRNGVNMREAYGVVQPWLRGNERERPAFEKAVRAEVEALKRLERAHKMAADAAQKKAAKDLEEQRIADQVNRGLAGVSAETRKAVENLRRLAAAKAPADQIAKAQNEAARRLAGDLAGQQGARATTRAILSDASGTQISGKDFQSIIRTSGASYAKASPEAKAAGARIGQSMAQGTMGGFEAMMFGSHGFWGRVLHTTSTFVVRNFAAGAVFGITNALQDMMMQALETQSTFIRISDALEQTGRSAGNLRAELSQISTDYGVALKDVYSIAAGLTGVFEETADISIGTRIVSQLMMISQGALNAQESMATLSSITSAYGMTGTDQLEHVADVLTVIQNETGSNMEVTAEGIARISGMAKQMKLSFEETGVFVAEIAKRTGQQGAAAAEQFQRILSVMQTGRGQNAIREIFPQLSGALNASDMSGVLRGMIEGWDDLTDAQRSYLGTTLGGQRQIAAFNALMGQGEQTMQALAAAENAHGEASARSAAISRQLVPLLQRLQQGAVNLVTALVNSGLLDGLGLVLMTVVNVLGGINKLINAINHLGETNEVFGFLQHLSMGLLGMTVAWKLGAVAVAGMTNALRAQKAMAAEAAVTDVVAGTTSAVAAGAGAAGAAATNAAIASPWPRRLSRTERWLEATAPGGLAARRARLAEEARVAKMVAAMNAAAAAAAAFDPSLVPANAPHNMPAPTRTQRWAADATRLRNLSQGIGAATPPTRLGRAGLNVGARTLQTAAFTAEALGGVSQAMQGLAKASLATKVGLAGVGIALTAMLYTVVSNVMDKSNLEDKLRKSGEKDRGNDPDQERTEGDQAFQDAVGKVTGTGIGGYWKGIGALGGTMAGRFGRNGTWATAGTAAMDLINPFSILANLNSNMDATAGNLSPEIQQGLDDYRRKALGSLREVDPKAARDAIANDKTLTTAQKSKKFKELEAETVERLNANSGDIAKQIADAKDSVANDKNLSEAQKAAIFRDLEATQLATKAIIANQLAEVRGLGSQHLLTIEQIAEVRTAAGAMQNLGTDFADLNPEVVNAFKIKAPEGSRTSILLNRLSKGGLGPAELARTNMELAKEQMESAAVQLEAAEQSGNEERADQAYQELVQATQQYNDLKNTLAVGIIQDAMGAAEWARSWGNRDQSIEILQDALDEAQSELTKLLKSFDEDHPLVIAAKQAVRSAQKAITDDKFSQATTGLGVKKASTRDAYKQARIDARMAEKRLGLDLTPGSGATADEVKADMEALAAARLTQYEAKASRRESRIAARNADVMSGVGQARLAHAAALRKLVDAYHTAGPGSEQVNAALAEVKKTEIAQFQSEQSVLAARQAFKAAGFRDSVRSTRAAEIAAFKKMQVAEKVYTRDSEEYWNARTEYLRSQQASVDAEFDLQAAYMQTAIARIAPGDAVAIAEAQLRAAQMNTRQMLEQYGAASTQYQSAIQAELSAQRAIPDAYAAVNEARLGFAQATADAAGKTLRSARIAAQIAEAKLQTALRQSGGKETAATVQARAEKIRAEAQVRDTQLQNRLDTIDFQMQMGRMTSSAAIEALKEIKRTSDLTRAQRRNLLLKIKGLRDEIKNSVTSSGFNIPGEIKMPTAYEVRRSLGIDKYKQFMTEEVVSATRRARELQGDPMGSVAGVHGGGTNMNIRYGDVRVEIHATVNNAAMVDQVARKVVQQISDASSRRGRANAALPKLVVSR